MRYLGDRGAFSTAGDGRRRSPDEWAAALEAVFSSVTNSRAFGDPRNQPAKLEASPSSEGVFLPVCQRGI